MFRLDRLSITNPFSRFPVPRFPVSRFQRHQLTHPAARSVCDSWATCYRLYARRAWSARVFYGMYDWHWRCCAFEITRCGCIDFTSIALLLKIHLHFRGSFLRFYSMAGQRLNHTDETTGAAVPPRFSPASRSDDCCLPFCRKDRRHNALASS